MKKKYIPIKLGLFETFFYKEPDIFFTQIRRRRHNRLLTILQSNTAGDF